MRIAKNYDDEQKINKRLIISNCYADSKKLKSFCYNLQYGQYKGADPIFKFSQWSYHVQIWHAQRKQSELGSILITFWIILNILVSRRGWTFLGVKFFEVLKKKQGSIRSEKQREREYGVRLRNDAKIAIFDAQPYFWNWNELKFTFFIHYHFFRQQNWSKSNRVFCATTTMVIINLALLTLILPKVS